MSDRDLWLALNMWTIEMACGPSALFLTLMLTLDIKVRPQNVGYTATSPDEALSR